MRINEVLDHTYLPMHIPGLKPSDYLKTTPEAYNQKLIEYLRTNCDPWLKATAYGGYTAYRGVSEGRGSNFAYVNQTRPDRMPRDTGKFRHNAFNAMFTALGSKANRSNSVFVTGSIDKASYYGTVFVIFPIGAFDYVWSTKHDLHDLLNFTHDFWFQYLKKPTILDPKDISMANTGDIRWDDPNVYSPKKLSSMFKVNQGLQSALTDNGGLAEVMVHCDSAVYVPFKLYNDSIRNGLVVI